MIRFSILAFCLILFSSVAYTKDEKTPSVSPRVYKALQKTEKLIAKKSYPKALQKLEGLLPNLKQGSYDQASILRSLSSIHALKGHYKMAAQLLAQCLDLNVLPDSQEQQALLNLGQLYMALDQYAKAINILEPWLRSHSNSDVQINALVANAYAQLKQYRKALPYIKKAIAQSKKPNEAWYQLNLALYYQLEDYSSASTLLKKLIRFYPDKKTYWQQLSSTYQQIKQYKKAVSIDHLSYKKGFISSEKEILALVNLFLYVDTPYKAATLLKKEIDQKRVKGSSKNWQTLANAWTMAKEFDDAIKALETASTLNEKGSLYLQLGQIYVEQEKWVKAVTALNKAVNKGGLKNRGAAHLLKGMCYYELQKLDQAKKSFLKATQYSKNKQAARQWLNYIKEKKQSSSIF